MTDVAPDDSARAPDGARINILAQFLRDFSFENPRAPDSLRPTGLPPGLEMTVEMGARGRPDGLFEVDLKVNLVARHGEVVAFQIEVVYGGLFELAGVPEDHIEPALLVDCPRLLFPFAARIIANVTLDGGFPPFQMEPIDFAAAYTAQRAQRGGDGLVLQ